MSTLQTGAFGRLVRIEAKYRISSELVPEIERDLTIFCQPDRSGKTTEDGSFQVTTMYLDTPSRQFLSWKLEERPSRFQLRIRCYGEHPENANAFHFEVKHRHGDVIVKDRATWNGSKPWQAWETPPEAWPVAEKDKDRLKDFLGRALQYGAEPVVLTQYRRRAWFGEMEEYSRVTFDSRMRFRAEPSWNWATPEREMQATDLPEFFQGPERVVMELKAPRDRIPRWMSSIVVRRNLVRTGFSKYGNAMFELDRPLYSPQLHCSPASHVGSPS